jgi:uncharacterized protein (TIGR02996 family)
MRGKLALEADPASERRYDWPMAPLARLLAAGTASFNALRAKGQVPVDQSAATLSQLFFARADLSKLDLSNAEFDECTVSDVDFRDCDLRGAFLHGGRFERCDFRGAKLEGATFERVEFAECDFSGASGLDALELDEVTGFGVTTPAGPALAEEPRFVPGHVAVNDALERELEAHPDDAKRWLVYADWLQAQGDLRGELITRHHAGTGFQAFVDEHLEQLFAGCADEVRGGGQVPELVLEWRHGFVVGATLSALNRERAVNLGDLAQRLLALPVCRFLQRLSFGLTHEVTHYGERLNDYAPVVDALLTVPALARLRHLEFGSQEPDLDEDSGEPEALHGWGDLSALWPHVPQLRELRIKGGAGVLGAVSLPELRAVCLQLEEEEPEVFSEVIAANWPKLERFELWDRFGAVELEPLLHVLGSLPLTHLALPFTEQGEPLLRRLVQLPLLQKLRVLDLHQAVLGPGGRDFLRENVAAFRHLERLDLTGTVGEHEEEALTKLGDFIVLRPPEDTRPVEEMHRPDWYELNGEESPDESPEAPEEDPPPPGADLDIPDEHGD